MSLRCQRQSEIMTETLHVEPDVHQLMGEVADSDGQRDPHGTEDDSRGVVDDVDDKFSAGRHLWHRNLRVEGELAVVGAPASKLFYHRKLKTLFLHNFPPERTQAWDGKREGKKEKNYI